ncbi:transcriptional regulator [Sporosarcina luteola]|uniref:Transcriptional regulator n=1 Tax=Sporosarcina luteola TaxID=582850 RepID=A0A511Z374_9BACL|nr:FMN-binding negative transcriptional regulator [Sporosarcina luteola]GEN81892.1 transcriptional regulator [Sporosarcina luteola]
MIPIYIPEDYKEMDLNRLVAFMKEFDFATIISWADQKPIATHLPFLIEQKGDTVEITSHMARANEQWRSFNETEEVLIIFQGPHSYISPKFYDSNRSVPTWNYASVHVYGTPHIVTDDRATLELLRKTIVNYESSFENAYNQIPMEHKSKLAKELVGFEINVTKIEGAFKLNQDKSTKEQERIAQALLSSEDTAISGIGKLMRENLGF